MKLQELGHVSHTPVSTIKYYLREGLLEPGAKRNATTSVYDESHVERLVLIHTLRQVVGLPIERVREVVEVVRAGDPVTLMGAVQAAALGLPSTTDADGSAENGSRVTAAQVVDAMGWSPGADDAAAALDRELRVISGWGIRSDLETVLVYARAADAVARYELGLPEGVTGGDRAPSPDRLATFVARGVYADSRLMLGMLALAQGSRAIERGDGAEPVHDGPTPPGRIRPESSVVPGPSSPERRLRDERP
ncbi:MerR family transcriptional regulator [Humibacter albus]|uniref:MerR family transcriptional regulator n=1 Tax=Humibacter albus TaxID=427754 RepID=UPI0003B55E02|nr:MerR family transcriptional regulator [Humibacter albus]